MGIKKSYLLIVNVLFLCVVFAFIEYICNGYWCYSLETTLTEPLFYGLASFLPTTLYLMFFSEQTFASWLKKIASWFLPLTFIMVASVDEGQGLFPMSSDGRNDVAILMMVILFIITLVYAPVMQKRLKGM